MKICPKSAAKGRYLYVQNMEKEKEKTNFCTEKKEGMVGRTRLRDGEVSRCLAESHIHDVSPNLRRDK